MPGSAMAAVLLLCSQASEAGQGMCAHTEVDVLKSANPLTNLQHVTPYFLNSLRERSVRRSQVTGPNSTRVSLGFSPINSSSYIQKIRLNTRITVEIQIVPMKSASQRPVLADSASLLCVNFTQFEFNPIDPGSRVLVSSPLDTRARSEESSR